MSIGGDLQSLALPRVLHSLSVQEQSGILTVQGEDDIVAISLLEGAIVSADALNQTVEEGLGEVLQERGLISEEDFDAAVKDHQGSGSDSLAELLVHRGLVSRDEVLNGLRRQTYKLILQVLTWRVGEFKFYAGDEVSVEDGFMSIPVEELLVKAIDDLGEPGGLPGSVPELEAAYRQGAKSVGIKVLGRDGDGTDDGVWIGPKQEALLLKVSSQTTAAALAAELDLNRYQAQFALYTLLRHDLIELAGDPRSAAAPISLGAPAPAAPAPSSQTVPLDLPTAPGEAAEPLRAEIFMPPEPGGIETGTDVESKDDLPELLMKFAAPTLGAAVALLLVLTLFFKPGSFLLPLPGQDAQRAAVNHQLRQSLYLKIDRAATTYFLVEAHYPDALEELAERHLISTTDLRDQAGHELTYDSANDGTSYRITPWADGAEALDLATTQAINGDFLLDNQFLHPPKLDADPLWLIE